MLCVTIAQARVDDLIAQHRQLAQQGAPLVELRLDYLEERIDVESLLSGRPGPVIVTCRRPADGGKFAGSEEDRLGLLRSAIAAGADYVDLEEDIAAAVPRSGSTRRIVSRHDFQGTPADLPAVHRRLCGLDPDLVKLVTTATEPHDNLRMIELLRTATVPTVGFCMGEIGMPTRVLAGRYGAPLSYAAADRQQAVAPGQLSFAEMKDLYRYDQIDAQTEVYGVIADPVGHSMSPLIHNTAFAHLGLNKVYLPFRVPGEHLAQFMDEIPQLGVKGLSITIPHKETVLPSLHEVEPSVRGIGAANTAVFDGRHWSGYNTDCQAALESLEEALGGKPAPAGLLAGKTALLLGSGGVGKAIAVGLLARGAQVVLTDGNDQRAGELAARLQCRTVPWAERYTVRAEILINATPLGMHPKVQETPYDKQRLRAGMVVFDVVYNPEYTQLLLDAQSRDCKTVSGLDMFVRQACLQFKLFTGQEGPAELMRDVLKKALGFAKR